MAVTIDSITQLDRYMWRIAYSSGLADPTFYIYKDAVLIDTTKATTKDFHVEPGESFLIEVLDDSSTLPETAFVGRLTLGWYPVTATDHYRMEEYVSSVWTLRAKVWDRGEGFFTWTSRFLEDETSHQFRIIPVGTNENQGTALSFTCLMVRHPNEPDVSWSYSNSTHKVTIAAA